MDRLLAGQLIRSQNCYICKRPFTLVDRFHHQLCPECADENFFGATPAATFTAAALLTAVAGGGMHIALRLLRDGPTTITTRFPKDAVRRFAAQPDSAKWLHRVRVIGIDLRDPAQVVRLADEVAAAGPLDILDRQRGADGAPLDGRLLGPRRRRDRSPDPAVADTVDWVSLGTTTSPSTPAS